MNEMYYRINRKLTDPLYDAKCTKREINTNTRAILALLDTSCIKVFAVQEILLQILPCREGRTLCFDAVEH